VKGIVVTLAALALATSGKTATTPGVEHRVQPAAHGRALADTHSGSVIGRSVEGRPIRVWRIGDPRSRRRALIVGCIHGNECAGMAVTSRLVTRAHAAVDLWVVQNLNPDGLQHNTRQNAHGIDLNRNFGAMWKRIGQPGSYQYSGGRPWSEPETRVARDLIRRLRPQVSIWFHQPQAIVRAWGPSMPTARRFAGLAEVPYRSLPWPNGTAVNWQNHAGMTSFVVELPAGPLDNTGADRYTDAILELLRSLER
jgi:protein MpaA